MEQNRDLSALEQNIGYKFKNINLLKNALTHTSYAYEHKIASNEKLEFLGDSILEFLSSKYIYNNYPNLKEGEMLGLRLYVRTAFTKLQKSIILVISCTLEKVNRCIKEIKK